MQLVGFPCSQDHRVVYGSEQREIMHDALIPGNLLAAASVATHLYLKPFSGYLRFVKEVLRPPRPRPPLRPVVYTHTHT